MKKLMIAIIVMATISLSLAIAINVLKSEKSSSDIPKVEEKEEQEREKLLSIADVSMNCFSNVLVIYDDNTYEILKGAYPEGEDPLISKGEYDYDIQSLINEIKNYPFDNKTGLNYRIVLNDNTSYSVSIMDSPKLNDFLGTIPDKNIFWCA